MQVDNGYKPLQVSLTMLWIYISQPIISPSHPENINEVKTNMRLICARLLNVLVL